MPIKIANRIVLTETTWRLSAFLSVKLELELGQMPRSKSASVRKTEGQRLRKLRTKLGLSLRELAEAFNVAHSAVSQWETGDRTMPGPALRLLDIYEAGRVKPEEKF